jgi:membrane protease YdiL (CAAX protease family)
VGFLIRRSPRETLERLGLTPPGARHLIAAALALGVLIAINAGAEAAQRRWFPALWTYDNQMTDALTRGLGTTQMLLLGVSAGVGEEITLRGALQPRLGIVVTALLFAALHVQYSWYGVAFIFLLGLVLGLVRARTSTTVAILAHAAYDVIASVAK